MPGDLTLTDLIKEVSGSVVFHGDVGDQSREFVRLQSFCEKILYPMYKGVSPPRAKLDYTNLVDAHMQRFPPRASIFKISAMIISCYRSQTGKHFAKLPTGA